MTKDEIHLIIKEYLKENLQITVNCENSSEYGYGDYNDTIRVDVELTLGDEVISTESSSVTLPTN